VWPRQHLRNKQGMLGRTSYNMLIRRSFASMCFLFLLVPFELLVFLSYTHERRVVEGGLGDKKHASAHTRTRTGPSAFFCLVGRSRLATILTRVAVGGTSSSGRLIRALGLLCLSLPPSLSSSYSAFTGFPFQFRSTTSPLRSVFFLIFFFWTCSSIRWTP
jgi:hypothetical protein